MHIAAEERGSMAESPANDAPQDRFADPWEVLERLLHDDDFPRGDVERIELHFQGSGEVTWRAWEPRQDEPIGGYLPAAPSH